jgi:hypothetical protein
MHEWLYIVSHTECLPHFCLWFWNEWSETDGMLQKDCLVRLVLWTINLPPPQQMAVCASVTKLLASTTRAFYMNHSVLLYGLSYETVNDQLLWELFSFALPSMTPSWLIFVSCSWGCCYHCGISNNLAHTNVAGFMWGQDNTYWPKPLEPR